METEKSPLLVYREKKDEKHTLEETKAAFEDSFAICFSFNQNRRPTSKFSLFASVWEVNPEAIIREVDLCKFGSEPKAMRDRFLLINKNGTKEMSNKIMQLVAESGAVSSAYCFISEKKAGIKECYHAVFGRKPFSPVYKGNLLADGSNMLLTVRHLENADRERIKTEKE